MCSSFKGIKWVLCKKNDTKKRYLLLIIAISIQRIIASLIIIYFKAIIVKHFEESMRLFWVMIGQIIDVIWRDLYQLM